MHSFWSFAASLFLVTLCSIVNGFYVPGVAPRDYSRGENVDIKVILFLIACIFYIAFLAYNMLQYNRDVE